MSPAAYRSHCCRKITKSPPGGHRRGQIFRIRQELRRIGRCGGRIVEMEPLPRPPASFEREEMADSARGFELARNVARATNSGGSGDARRGAPGREIPRPHRLGTVATSSPSGSASDRGEPEDTPSTIGDGDAGSAKRWIRLNRMGIRRARDVFGAPRQPARRQAPAARAEIEEDGRPRPSGGQGRAHRERRPARTHTNRRTGEPAHEEKRGSRKEERPGDRSPGLSIRRIRQIIRRCDGRGSW